MKADYIGPCTIKCDESCEVPAGMEFTETPRPRHAWRDIIYCPYCPRSFIVAKTVPKFSELEEVDVSTPSGQDYIDALAKHDHVHGAPLTAECSLRCLSEWNVHLQSARTAQANTDAEIISHDTPHAL